MKTTLISIIAILATLLVTIAYGKTTLVTKSEFELIIDRLDRIDAMVLMILENHYHNKSFEVPSNDDSSKAVSCYKTDT